MNVAVRSVGVKASAIGAIAPAWGTHLPGDIGILLVQTTNQAVTLSTPAGFTEVLQIGTGAAGAAGSTRVTVFVCLATSAAMATPTVADSGDHQLGIIITVSGGRLPLHATNTGTAVSGTAVSIPGLTTTIAKCLVLALVCDGFDGAGTTRGSGWANADLSGIAEVLDEGNTVGTGGGYVVASGTKTVPGAVGVTTGTLANAAVQALVSLAIAPALPVGHSAGHSVGHIVGHT